jgi:HEAT repeat protein
MPFETWQPAVFEQRYCVMIDEPGVEQLIEQLHSTDVEIRRQAAELLSYLGDNRAVEPLILALQDDMRSVRQWAVIALGDLGDARAIEPLVTLLLRGDEDHEMEYDAREALFEFRGFKSERAVEKLIQALSDDNPNRRAVAAEVLAWIHDSRAVEPLINALADEQSDVRQYAANALGSIGDTRAIEALRKALSDQDYWVRRMVSAALNELEDNLNPLA